MSQIKIKINRQPTINASIKSEQMQIGVKEKIQLTIPTEHNKLLGLTYEESGHTGFASELALTQLENKVVPKSLTILPTAIGLTTQQYVYIDNNGTPSKLSVKEINSKVLRTVDIIPSDLEEGQYVLLKK